MRIANEVNTSMNADMLLVNILLDGILPLLFFGLVIPLVVIVGLPLLLFFPIPAIFYALYKGMDATTLRDDIKHNVFPLIPISKRRSQNRPNQGPPSDIIAPPRADTGSECPSHVTA